MNHWHFCTMITHALMFSEHRCRNDPNFVNQLFAFHLIFLNWILDLRSYVVWVLPFLVIRWVIIISKYIIKSIFHQEKKRDCCSDNMTITQSAEYRNTFWSCWKVLNRHRPIPFYVLKMALNRISKRGSTRSHLIWHLPLIRFKNLIFTALHVWMTFPCFLSRSRSIHEEGPARVQTVGSNLHQY